MRNFFAVLLAFGVFSFQINDLKAAEVNNQKSDLNNRLRSLQTRLQDFHKLTSQKIEAKLKYSVSAESMIIPVSKFEPQISIDGNNYSSNEGLVELDDNEQASVLVLYHDSQFFDEQKELNQQSKVSESEQPKIEFEHDELIENKVDNKLYKTEKTDSKINKIDYANRYSEMKRKVLMVYSRY